MTKTPRVVVGAPVAERAWILPTWFEHLKAQTLQPDDLLFVYTKSEDGTEDVISDLCPDGIYMHAHQSKLPYYERNARNANKSDPWRAKHMAKLRNELRRHFFQTKGDVFVSLDTDILLTDPRTLERLVDAVTSGRWDVAAALTYLHPTGAASECYNAGFFPLKQPGEFDRMWVRATRDNVVQLASPVQIDIPMAIYAIRRWALARCRYKAHESGEDMGFADSLEQNRMRCGWFTDLEARHVWDPAYLSQEMSA